jgi:hypothetical protein
MTHIEFIRQRTPDGTVVLHAIVVGPLQRLRRRLRRILR